MGVKAQITHWVNNKLDTCRSVRTRRREMYARLLKAHPELISDEAIKDIADNAVKNDRLRYKMGAIQFALFMFLLANLFNVKAEVKIFEITVGSGLPVREILLLATSLLGLAIFILQQQTYDMEDIVSEQLRARYSDGAPIAGFRYRRLDGQLFRGGIGDEIPIRAFNVVAMVGTIVLGIVGMSALAIAQVAAHMIVIWRMWEAPNIPPLLNHLIIVAVLSFDLMSFCLFVFERVPYSTPKAKAA